MLFSVFRLFLASIEQPLSERTFTSAKACSFFFLFFFFNYTLLPVQKEYWALPVHNSFPKSGRLGPKVTFFFLSSR